MHWLNGKEDMLEGAKADHHMDQMDAAMRETDAEEACHDMCHRRARISVSKTEQTYASVPRGSDVAISAPSPLSDESTSAPPTPTSTSNTTDTTRAVNNADNNNNANNNANNNNDSSADVSSMPVGAVSHFTHHAKDAHVYINTPTHSHTHAHAQTQAHTLLRVSLPASHLAHELVAGLRDQFERQVLCDIGFRVWDEDCGRWVVVRAHRVVVAAASSVFVSMLTRGGWCEAAQPEVTLNDVPARSLRAALSFIYTGSISGTLHEVLQLLSTADRLALLSLRLACVSSLSESLCHANCGGLLAWADAMLVADLRESAGRFVKREFGGMGEGELEGLPMHLCAELLRSDDLLAPSEEFIFEWVLHWLYANTDATHTNHHLMTEAEETLFPHIRFALMPATYLQHKVLPLSTARGWEKLGSLVTEALELQSNIHTSTIKAHMHKSTHAHVKRSSSLPLPLFSSSTCAPYTHTMITPRRSAGCDPVTCVKERALGFEHDVCVYLALAAIVGSPNNNNNNKLAASKGLPGVRDCGTLEVWCTDTWECTALIPVVTDYLCMLALPAGTTHTHPRLLCGGMNGTISVWNADTWRLERTIYAHRHAVTALTYTNDGHVISSSFDGRIMVFRSSDWSCERVLEGHRTVHSLALCGDRLVSGRVWNVKQWACVYTMSGDCEQVTALAAMEPGVLLIGYDDGGVEVWDCSRWGCVRSFAAHTSAIKDLQVKNGKLVSSGEGGDVAVWNVSTWACERRITHSELGSVVGGVGVGAGGSPPRVLVNGEFMYVAAGTSISVYR
eukprot:jgi/Chlat1/3598/Chrsp234S03582